MELNNQTLFFIGIIFVILGSMIIIFDYPQIQFLDKVKSDQNYWQMDNLDIHQRLKIEIAIGFGFLVIGIVLFIISFLSRFKNRFR
jgi:hypothetical protein